MFITIDPGSTGTGYAIWKTEDWENVKYLQFPLQIKPIENGVIFKNIIMTLKKICIRSYIHTAYIENASYWENSNRGQVSARSGSLVKLSEFIGKLEEMFSSLGVGVYLISVQKWKGTMTKKAVIHRIKKYAPLCEGSSHDWDAIGLGLYCMGVLK